jgi:hypothetical protein
MSIRREVRRRSRQAKGSVPCGAGVGTVEGGVAVGGPVVRLVWVLVGVDLDEIKRWGSVGTLHLLDRPVGEAVGDVGGEDRGDVVLVVVHVTTRSLLGSLGGDIHAGDWLVGDVDSELSVGT